MFKRIKHRYKILSFFLFFIGIVLVFSWYNLGDKASLINLNRPSPLEQDPYIQVYFNHNFARGADYSDPYRNIKRPGDNLEQIMSDTIESAESTIDVAVQEFRLPNLARSLAERAKKGVQVRVILENNYSYPWSDLTPEEVEELDERSRARYQDFFDLADRDHNGKLSAQEIAEGDALVILDNAKIPIIDDTADGSQGSGLMHHKFIIIDNNITIVTSANFTTSDVHGDIKNTETRGNANNLLKIESPEVASIFTEEFEAMWGDGPGGELDSQFGVNKPFRAAKKIVIGDTSLTVQFSPTSRTIPWENSSNGLIGYVLDRASRSVELALFVFSEQSLADILEIRHQKGVNIRALIDPEFAFRNYSEALDMLGVALSRDCQYEENNRPWEMASKTVGIPELIPGDKLHHKFGIVDGEKVITGSHNWSAAANQQNDETLIILQNPKIASHYLQEFERLYSNSQLGIPTSVQEKIEKDSQECLDSELDREENSELDADISSIDLNQASQEELESLPGIGETIAERIIEEREKAPFTSLEDLQRVRGIGKSKIKKLEGLVTW